MPYTEAHPQELHLPGEEHTHPSDQQYYVIAAILAAITALEVATYYINFFSENSTALLVALLPMMVVKFGMVAAFFMHLRFDSKLFRRVFLAGIAFAVGVYMIMLTMFHVFTR